MDKSKKIVLTLMIVLIVLTGVLSVSFAWFRKEKEANKFSVLPAEFKYDIISDDIENNRITVPANTYKELTLKVKSLNDIKTKYELVYNAISLQPGAENKVVSITNDEEVKGLIDGNGYKLIHVLVQNDSSENYTVEFKVLGGFENYEIVKNGQESINPYETKVWEFDYTGNIQELIAPIKGTYKLEVWGSQGGTSTSRQGVTYRGGYGAYSTGEIKTNGGEKMFILVGGINKINGGGIGSGCYSGNCNGGDATHIAKETGPIKDLNIDNIYIISAGGGGGYGYPTLSTADYSGIGGEAGGISGKNGNNSGACYWLGLGAIQTSGGKSTYCSGVTSAADGGIKTADYGIFGVGGRINGGHSGGGGGGGLYGGGFSHYAGGGGGSSYIGNSLLTKKHMTCFNCATSNVESTMTQTTTNVSSSPISDYAKSGTGYAKITLVEFYEN